MHLLALVPPCINTLLGPRAYFCELYTLAYTLPPPPHPHPHQASMGNGLRCPALQKEDLFPSAGWTYSPGTGGHPCQGPGSCSKSSPPTQCREPILICTSALPGLRCQPNSLGKGYVGFVSSPHACFHTQVVQVQAGYLLLSQSHSENIHLPQGSRHMGEQIIPCLTFAYSGI